jgi:uncharacterized delta-60 repeat protein
MAQTNTAIQNLLVIDSQVTDWQSLAAGAGADTVVLILDSGTDGLTQISDYLSNSSIQGLSLLQSIQIISHGSSGTLQLGSSTITKSNLGLYAKQLAKIGSSLTDTGDILLFGCNVAQGDAGLAFIQSISDYTGADVAASTDLTGILGNWNLEAHVGQIETTTPFAGSQIVYNYNLANNAPVLTSSNPILTSITEDDIANTGQTVASFLGASLSDVDANALQGIALYGVTGGYGKWQYSTNSAVSWSDVGVVSSSSALLIRSTDSLRWLPDGTNGTTATLNYYGWDLTFGAVANKVVIATRGGASAFSSTADTATLIVSSINDAPWLNTPIIDQTITEDANLNFTVPSATFVTDVGDFLTYSALLADGHLLPEWLSFNSDTLTFSGTPTNSDVGYYDIKLTVYDTSNLTTSDTFRITVDNVNNAPVLTSTNPILTSITEDDIANPGQAVASFLSTSLSDVDANALQGIALYGVTGEYGKWQYSTSNGVSWSDVGVVSASSALLLRSTDSLRWLPDGSNGTTATLNYYGWDQSSGTAGTTGSVVARGGTTAFSLVADTATLEVASVNDVPLVKMAFGYGKVTTVFGAEDRGYSVTVQSDGKILVAGYTSGVGSYDFALARYNSNGSLDASFDGDGKVTTDFGADETGKSVTVQSDGKILVAGYSYSYIDSNSNLNFALARYNSNGSLDTSFDGDGKVTTDFGALDSVTIVTFQSDGKILVAGHTNLGGSYNFALARYNTDGNLDASFDGDGKVTTDFGADETGKSVTVQSDGKILVAGHTNLGGSYNFALARYNSDGSLDASFDGDGKVTTDFVVSAVGYSVTFQSDGKILVAGYTDLGVSSNFVLARYNTDGSLDASFDGDGKVTTDFGAYDLGHSVTVQSDGKILVAGSSIIYGIKYSSNFALARYNTDGSLDTSFDGDGKVTTNFGGNGDGYSVTLQSDGKILVAGYTSLSGSANFFHFALARYNSDGSLDFYFDENQGSNLSSSITSYIEKGSAVSLSNAVQVNDPELNILNNYSGFSLTLSRQGGASSQDEFSASGVVSSLIEGTSLTVSGIAIGTVTKNSTGQLTLSFNNQATQSLVSTAMQSISYSNSSYAPPASVQIDWIFNDGNTGSQGTGGAQSVTGNTIVNIILVNDAPVLTPINPILTSITEDDITNTGQTVASFLGASLSDVDANALQGIALYGVNGDYGKWQYSTNSAVSWSDVGVVSTSSALLLRNTDSLRWLPDGSNGTTATLNYYGWDQSSGTAGTTGSVVARGGTTAFSLVADTATLGVASVDDAPRIITSISDQNAIEDTAFNFHFSLNIFSEVDVGDTIVGYWVSLANDDTLPNWLSFNPDTLTFSGTPTNSDVGYYDIKLTVYDTSYLTTSDTFRITVDNVNDAPVLTPIITILTGITEDDIANTGQTVASFLSTSLSDVDANALQGIALYGVNGDYGKWQYSTNSAVSWSDVGVVSTSAALLLRSTDSLRWLPDGSNGTTATLNYYGWDQSSGASGTKASLVTRGDTTAFSLVADTAALDVTSIDDVPLIKMSFGYGKVTTDFGADETGQSVTVQSDGKILVAGYTRVVGSYDFALARYNSNGSLDTSFDGDGKVTTDFGGNDNGQSITVQSDGKILVAGYTSTYLNGSYNFALARYNSDGSLDNSFDGDGKVTTDFFGGYDFGQSVTVQSDGRILVAGFTTVGSYGFALVRYNGDGSLDTSFDGDGKVTTDFGGDDYGYSVTVQSDGKILVAGFTYTNFSGITNLTLARYNSNGSLDTSFDGDGKVTTDFGTDDRGQSVTVQSDGKILVTGYT